MTNGAIKLRLPDEIWSLICNNSFELAWKLQHHKLMSQISKNYHVSMTIKLQNGKYIFNLYRDIIWRFKSRNYEGIIGLQLIPDLFLKQVLMWTLEIDNIVLKCPGNISVKASDLVDLYTRIGKPIFVSNFESIKENSLA
eukprot:NODE_71_length_24927_cov_1.205937.p19 type:complete len:140 gc:universal NODE_71_length_24927_cov_1.205937:24451-24870(+)